MSGSPFRHRRREEIIQISLSEQTDGSFPEVQDLSPDRTLSDSSLPRLPLPKRKPHAKLDTAPGSQDPTTHLIAPRERPTISVTPPDESPTVRHDQSSPFQLGTDLMSLEILRILSRSRAQSTWPDERGRTPRRSRARSDSSASTDRRRSWSPSMTNRHCDVVDLPGYSDGWENHPDGAMDQANPENERNAAGDPSELFSAAPRKDQSLQWSHLGVWRDAGYPKAEGLCVYQEEDAEIDEDTASVGKWRCCECRRGHQLHRFNAGDHLVSILNCLCKHRSCRSCTFEGNIRHFAPIDDLAGMASVPILQDNGTPIQFGVICRTCGLSWRAQKIEAPKRYRSFRQRLSILPKKANPLHKLRHTRSMIHLRLSGDQPDASRPGTALSASRSVFNLRSVSDSQAKRTRPEEQAPGAEVRFYGIECTCGTVTNSNSLCFQVMDSPEVEQRGTQEEQMSEVAVKAAEPKFTPELRAKGYGTPMLHLKGGSHPNPLLNSPVQESEST